MTLPILLVEDNADDELLTVRAFKKAQIANELLVAHDGAEALELLFGEGAHAGIPLWPQLVLLDVKLPRIDGITVLRRLRSDARTKLLPVVMLTSSQEERDLLDSYEGGANSFIRKPVSFEEFSEAVRSLGLYWTLVNKPPPTPGS